MYIYIYIFIYVVSGAARADERVMYRGALSDTVRSSGPKIEESPHLRSSGPKIEEPPPSSFFGFEDRRNPPHLRSSEPKIGSKISAGPVLSPGYKLGDRVQPDVIVGSGFPSWGRLYRRDSRVRTTQTHPAYRDTTTPSA